MSKTKIAMVVGTRPNYPKFAPTFHLLKKHYDLFVIDSGQHTKEEMSKNLWDYFNLQFNHIIKLPLDLSERRKVLISELKKQFMKFFGMEYKNSYVMVFGDTDTTLLGSVAAHSLGIPLIHLEGGLRSFDSVMREERNRIVSDNLSHIIFTTEKFGNEQLIREGIKNNVFLVGNVIIDSTIAVEYKKNENFDKFFLLTLHRPELVDDISKLHNYLRWLNTHSPLPIVFPIHPRTENKMGNLELYSALLRKIHFIKPLNYPDFINLIQQSNGVITDSGGVVAEAAFLKKKCFTMRFNIEQPCTMECGSNKILTNNTNNLDDRFEHLFNHLTSSYPIFDIPLWDGKTSERILNTLQGLGI